jgi:hypothetical protein
LNDFPPLRSRAKSADLFHDQDQQVHLVIDGVPIEEVVALNDSSIVAQLTDNSAKDEFSIIALNDTDLGSHLVDGNLSILAPSLVSKSPWATEAKFWTYLNLGLQGRT